MAFTETLRLIVDMDVGGAVKNVETFGSKAEKEGDRAKKSLDRVGHGLQKTGAGMMTFGAVAVAGLLSAGNAASDLNEVASKSETVFGEANVKVVEFAENAAKIGLSKRAALEAAGGFGNMFDQLGIASDKAAEMSIQITGLASDFASFHNADITTVLEAQSAAFRGEYDSIQQFLPLLSAATVEQKAMALTGQENKDALTAQDKALAVYQLMLDGAGAAQGDFERTSGSAANQQRILAAEFENVKAQLGQGVLPMMKTGLGIINSVVGGFSDLNAVTDGTAGKLATFGAVGLIAAGGLSSIIGKVITMRENFASAAQGIGSFSGKLKGVGVAAGVATAIVGVAFALDQMENARQAAKIDKLTEDFLATGDASDALAKAVKGGRFDIADFAQMFDKLAESNLEAAERLLDSAEAAGVEAKWIDMGREALERKRDAEVQATVDQEAHSEAVRETADAMREAAPAAKTLDEELEAQAEAAKAAEEELKKLNDALDSILAGFLSVPQALAEQNSKLLETTEHFKEMREEYGRNALSLDIGTEAGIKNTEMLDGIFESAGGVIEKMRETGETEQAVQLQWANSRAQLQLVIDKFRAAGVDVSKYDALIGAIDRHVTTNVRVTGLAAAGGQMGEFRRKYDNQTYTVWVQAKVKGGGVNIGGGVKVFHDGGIVPGPRGQEVAAILQAGEEILAVDDPKNSANAQLPVGAADAGGGWGATTTIINLNVHPGAFAGAIISSEDEADRWVAGAFNRAAARGIPLHIQGRPL